MADYFTVLTLAGQAALANALATGGTVALTDMAVGDGGGAPVTPTETMTALVGEVYRASIDTLTVDPDNPHWLIAELVIPPDVGGWSVREVGVFDAAGTTLAVANLPEAYKPVLAEGSTRDMVIRMVLEVSDTAAVTLVMDPTVMLASRSWVISVLPGYATTETPGLVELATVAEAVAGTDTVRAVTPEGLAAHVGDRLGDLVIPTYGTATTETPGLVELATAAEARAGTDDQRAVTPVGLTAARRARRPHLYYMGQL